MGYDEREQAGSSGTAVAIVVAVLIVAVLGLVVVGGAALFWVRTSAQQARAIEMEQRAIAEAHQAEAEARRAVVAAQLAQARLTTAPVPKISFEVTIDREGNVGIDCEGIDQDELRARLAKLKKETSNVISVLINADPECTVKLLVPLLDVCDQVGDIDFRVASSDGTDLRLTATVVSYEPAAEWDHFDDGTFAAYDKLTLKVVAPQQHAGAAFSVTVPPTELPENSALRTAGTRFTLRMRESDIGTTGLAWGAIDAAAIVQ